MWLSVSSTTWDSLEIGDYVKRNLVDAFSSVPGTGRVIVGGINEKAVRVYLNPVKLSANDLDIGKLKILLEKIILLYLQELLKQIMLILPLI